MTVKVKICGLRSTQALDAALDAGADYIGLVFYGPSPRNVDIETAQELAERARGRAQSVALLVDPDDRDVDEVAQKVNPDLIQLHGDEPPERVAEIRRRAGRPVMKAVRVATRDDVEAAGGYDAADIILYDAKAPEGETFTLPGGNGIPFDWKALAGVKNSGKFMLSGGLDPDNVRTAIDLTGAGMVDVSSGVERAPGEKDPALIRRFITAAKARK